MKLGFTFGLVAPLLLAVGCQTQHPYSYVTPGGQVISTGPGSSTADTALEASIRAQLDRYGELAAASQDTHISAENGAVTVNGSVPNERDREMIDTLVRNTPGVIALNDQMQAGYPPTGTPGQPPAVYSSPGAPNVVSAPVVTPPPVVTPGVQPYLGVQARTPADEPIARNIAEQLRADSIPASSLQGTSISVTDGNVSLQGQVDNQQEHQALVTAVQSAPGVRAVYDQLQVR